MVVLLKDEGQSVSCCQGGCLTVSVGASTKAVTIKEDRAHRIFSALPFSLKHLSDATGDDIKRVATTCASYAGVYVKMKMQLLRDGLEPSRVRSFA